MLEYTTTHPCRMLSDLTQAGTPRRPAALAERPIAVLCAAHRSVYCGMSGVEVYDRNRDARTFGGGMPVIAHPPCRSWSAKCRHQAKPEPGEQGLGLWCAEQVKRWGGVLEQPAYSLLWEAAELPRPGITSRGYSWSLEIWQAWFGYPMKKATWLYFSNIFAGDLPPIPYRLHPRGGDRLAEQRMSKQQRSATSLEFAEWLVRVARFVDIVGGSAG
jgi:hypothetical protein